MHRGKLPNGCHATEVTGTAWPKFSGKAHSGGLICRDTKLKSTGQTLIDLPYGISGYIVLHEIDWSSRSDLKNN